MTPRTEAFSRARVIDAAIESFTQHGYAGADASTLSREAGLSRSSLYNSFGSRDGLFVQALGEYSRRGREEAAALAVSEGRALGLLRARLLDGVLEQSREGSRSGCLTVNLAIELGRSHPEAARIIDEDREAWVAAHAALLRRAQEEGDLVAGLDADALGLLLHSLLAGLRVAARVEDETALRIQVDALLASWATRLGLEALGEPQRSLPDAAGRTTGAPGASPGDASSGIAETDATPPTAGGDGTGASVATRTSEVTR